MGTVHLFLTFKNAETQNVQTDRQTDKQTNRQTDKQIEGFEALEINVVS